MAEEKKNQEPMEVAIKFSDRTKLTSAMRGVMAGENPLMDILEKYERKAAKHPELADEIHVKWAGLEEMIGKLVEVQEWIGKHRAEELL